MYNEFLKKINILSEEHFYEIIDLFPRNIKIDELDLTDFDLMDSIEGQKEVIARSIFEHIFIDYNFVYLDSIDIDRREIEIGDLDSIEDLEKIKKILFKWNITNYEELKKELLEDIEISKVKDILMTLSDKITEKEALEIVEKYDKR